MSTRSKSVADQIIDALLEAFPPEINQGKDGEQKNVKPGYYVEKLLNLRKLGANVSITYPNGNGFLVEVDGAYAFSKDVRVRIDAEGFEGTGDGTGSVAIIVDKEFDSTKLANAVKAASSDGLKRACLNLGINLSTYLGNDLEDEEEDDEEEKPRSRRGSSRRSRDDEDENENEDEEKPRSRGRARNNDDDNEDEEKPRGRSNRGSGSSRGSRGSSKKWDGTKKVPIGKHKDEEYSEVPGSWLVWAVDTLDPKDGPCADDAQKEIDRRKDDGTFDPEEGKPKGRRGGRTNRSSGKRSGRALDNEYE